MPRESLGQIDYHPLDRAKIKYSGVAEARGSDGARTRIVSRMIDVPGLRHITTPLPTPLRRQSTHAPFAGSRMPRSMFGFMWRVSAWDQIWLALLAISVSLLGLAPIEFQRRIVNEAVKQKNWDPIWTLAAIYLALVVAHGLIKYLFNLYKGWVGANATRSLRTSIGKLTHGADEGEEVADTQGVEISMIVSECDAIGTFASDCITEPVLEGGILLTVFGYMFVLQPTMALVTLGIFIPQAVFVPIIQRAINRKVEGRIKTLRKAGADVLVDEADVCRTLSVHEARFRKVFRYDFSIIALKNGLNFLMNLCQHAGTVVIVALGGWFVIKGQTQVGTVVAFLSSLSHITDPWGAVVGWFQTYMVTTAKYALVRDAVAKLQEVDATACAPPGQGHGDRPIAAAAEAPA